LINAIINFQLNGAGAWVFDDGNINTGLCARLLGKHVPTELNIDYNIAESNRRLTTSLRFFFSTHNLRKLLLGQKLAYKILHLVSSTSSPSQSSNKMLTGITT